MTTKLTPAPWQASRCNAPMWMGGAPAGLCGANAYGHQLPRAYLREAQGRGEISYCFGHACPEHGGPSKTGIRIFQDGLTDQGRPMWCAVAPDFINLQESPAGFDGDPMQAVENLGTAIAKARGAQ